MRGRIEYKTADQIRAMRRAGLVVADIHDALREAAAPGMSTAELDEVARDVLDRAGARSNFLGYHGYPAHVCISVNEEVVHGIPGSRVLRDGDVVSFDCGAVVEGWHGDAAFTVVLGEGDPQDRALSGTTRTAMWDAIAALARGARRSGSVPHVRWPGGGGAGLRQRARGARGRCGRRADPGGGAGRRRRRGPARRLRGGGGGVTDGATAWDALWR